MTKVYAAARALAVLLAIVAAFMAIPNVNVAALLVGLGLVAGLGTDAEATPRALLSTIALPVVAVALAHLPAVGTHLAAIATNLGLATAGIAATAVALRVFAMLMTDWGPKSA
ncbi:MAG: hypothetical protein ABL882_03045 [Sphingopyxis sp.]